MVAPLDHLYFDREFIHLQTFPLQHDDDRRALSNELQYHLIMKNDLQLLYVLNIFIALIVGSLFNDRTHTSYTNTFCNSCLHTHTQMRLVCHHHYVFVCVYVDIMTHTTIVSYRNVCFPCRYIFVCSWCMSLVSA